MGLNCSISLVDLFEEFSNVIVSSGKLVGSDVRNISVGGVDGAVEAVAPLRAVA